MKCLHQILKLIKPLIFQNFNLFSIKLIISILIINQIVLIFGTTTIKNFGKLSINNETLNQLYQSSDEKSDNDINSIILTISLVNHLFFLYK